MSKLAGESLDSNFYKAIKLGFGSWFGGFSLADLPDKKVPPPDLAAMCLQHDRAFGWKGLGAIPVVFHGSTVDDQLVVQPNPGAIPDLANSELIPVTEGFVGDDGWVASWCIWGVVKQAAGAEVGFSVGFFGIKGLRFVPYLDLRVASEIDAAVCAGDGLVFDEKFDITERFVGSGVGAGADVDEFAVFDMPMGREFCALLLVVGFFFVAGEFGGGVGIEAMPAGEIAAVKDDPEAVGRGGVGHGDAGEDECRGKGEAERL